MVLPPDSQLFLILYLVWICRRQRIPRYAVGRSRRRLDCVRFEVFHRENRCHYLFSVHQRQYTKRNISYAALMSSSSEISLVRRFEAYLRVKHELKSVGREIVVWTEAAFRKRDSELQQMLELCETPDWLETGLLGVRRYRVKRSVELEESLLKLVLTMPAKERSERGENKTDGSDFELYTKLECIRAVRDRTDVEEYTVGKELAARFGALDDVVLNVTLRGTRELTYALQAKQTLEGDPSKPDKVISSQDLWRECGNKNYYVAKYFASYLKIKQHTRPEQLKEMIIWTTQSIADTALTNFEPYVTDGQDDILKPVLGSDVRRWKFDSSKMDHPDYGDLKQLLLDEVHPLKAVVDKFISVMFKKETWDSNKGARNYYRIMAQEVIDCDMKVFQDRFIRGDCSLDSNTQLFRRIFERAMALKIPKFSMDLLNSENYKRYFILQIDDQFQKGNGQYAWKVESSASQADLEDFIARFVFYVNVPKVADFRNKLTQKLGANRFKELCGLVQQCTVEQMASKAEIDAIFELLVLRSKTNLKKDPGLEFEGDDGGLRSVLKDNNRIFIEADQDIDCSVNRVFMTEEFANAMQPCLAFRYRNFERYKTNEFSHYLAKSCTETERFTLIRSSMNATSFSVFDLLHASLTESDRRKLRFRFGGEVNETENRHLINLKRLGGNQTLQLLRVLRRKHGTSFVGDILTNFLDDEEDFIAVACRKPFLEVFRWLFERVPELVVEERDALLEYLRKRVPGYLEVLIQHNNAALLEEIIVWVQSNWSREVLVTWVENYELLWVFASNVGRKCMDLR
ncbi:conserved hypothetical protein [Culex quinquefasciatus]|uniref:Uncharacterized protein n=1 Tax=Culex quinquefasciatus TaxID=7176 RepID=B0WKR9_CULQU|nr:conserved hypothetical protein [Culex quinquefasciatus]|eukprot:XP_001849303.1 conserved hypothetical protein [Culex quinquefasciatus]